MHIIFFPCLQLICFCVFLGLIRDFWRRHKRKVYVTLGVVGSGYALYRLYDAHTSRLRELEAELAVIRDNDERIKAQLR